MSLTTFYLLLFLLFLSRPTHSSLYSNSQYPSNFSISPSSQEQAKKVLNPRVLAVGEEVELEDAIIEYTTAALLGGENEVTVVTDPRKTGAVIYMNVTNTCRKDLHFNCVRHESTHPDYKPNFISAPIVKQLEDLGNGKYRGIYKVDEPQEGYVTLSFYSISHGLHRVCYDGREYKEPPYAGLTDPKLFFDWGREPICLDREDMMSIRWKGTLIIERNGHYKLRGRADDYLGIYIDGQLLIEELHATKDQERYTGVYLTAGEHDFEALFNEYTAHGIAELFWWNENISDYEPIPSKSFSCVGSMWATENIVLTCILGYFFDHEAKTCVECPEGTYKEVIGPYDCDLCPRGTYNEGKAATKRSECKDCPAGSTSPPGSSSVRHCVPCPRGTYGARSQAGNEYACEPCAAGTYNNEVGQASETSCLKCPVMSYGDREGLSSCKECLIKTYTEISGSTSCLPCDPLCNYCYGPLNTQCTACVESATVLYVAPDTCECPYRYYYDILSLQCEPCSVLCPSCFGPSSEQCYRCDAALSYEVEDRSNVCVPTCDDEYYKDSTLCKCTVSPLLCSVQESV
eukprot:TRINITY_DN11916_c0_g1_i4.p1 TRINITY_DN11916_c0_g1~~TRINITY_DN11916_c0_g1_i4.p1  ORF type:complete len:573 (+),score=41.61 TRINITY_DN11916_c0_g1_i4:259-1977(+)